jgi:hypothetical protein
MAEWKKVIVSGSVAELSKIVVDGQVSASLFSGSFVGDGSGLTGLEGAINTYTNPGDNRIITSVDATSVNAEANLTFDGSTLTVTGSATITGNTTLGEDSGDAVTINASTIFTPNIAAGTDNTVVVYNGSSLVTDEIDSRVWGTTLLDNNGTPLTSGRVPYVTDGDSLIDSTNLKFTGTTLIANAATITTDLLVSGDLTVVGTASFQHTDSLTVADRFILLASGSNSAGMGGLVVQQSTQDIGEVFSWDNTTSRWATTGSFNASSNTFTPEAFMASVIDIDNGNTDIAKYQKNGNIKVDGGEIYIYS